MYVDINKECLAFLSSSLSCGNINRSRWKQESTWYLFIGLVINCCVDLIHSCRPADWGTATISTESHHHPPPCVAVAAKSLISLFLAKWWHSFLHLKWDLLRLEAAFNYVHMHILTYLDNNRYMYDIGPLIAISTMLIDSDITHEYDWIPLDRTRDIGLSRREEIILDIHYKYLVLRM